MRQDRMCVGDEREESRWWNAVKASCLNDTGRELAIVVVCLSVCLECAVGVDDVDDDGAGWCCVRVQEVVVVAVLW